PISHTTTDTTIEVYAATDIAITNITTSKTIIGQGYTLQINVTVTNEGTTQTFDITAYANSTIIQTQTTTLNQNTSTTLTFNWNTTNWQKGNYTIWASVPQLPGETDTADNTLTDGNIFISLVGDVDADRKVDIRDIFAIALHYGTKIGDPNYDSNLDVDCDNKIDIRDIFATALHYGEKDP
ncbi:MAG: CARDB domain-containing protein, partial [Candidatus Heimdallarchaeaceae archaeon]